MKNAVSIALVAVLIVAGGIYLAFHKSSDNAPQTTQQGTQTQDTTWKTYTDADTGFTIKYPPQYVVEAQPAPTNFKWGSRTLLTISDAKDKSTNEFHVTAAQVTLLRQPVVASGKIYHTIAEYQQSGTAAQMVQGAPDPDGELVTVNGMQALRYYFPAGDASDGSSDAYFFIKDDLIYEISFNTSDLNGKGMLQSISWQ